MASSTLRVDLTARDKSLGKTLGRAERDARRFRQRTAKAFKDAGRRMAQGIGVGTAALGALTIATTNYYKELQRFSKQTGASIRDISALRVAISRAGGDVSEAGELLSTFRERAGEAFAEPDGSIGEAFRSIGLDAAKLNRLGTLDALQQTVRALNSLDPNVRLFRAREIAGDAEALALTQLRVEDIAKAQKSVSLATRESAREYAALSAQVSSTGELFRNAFGEGLAGTGRVSELTEALRTMEPALESLGGTLGRITADLIDAAMQIAGIDRPTDFGATGRRRERRNQVISREQPIYFEERAGAGTHSRRARVTRVPVFASDIAPQGRGASISDTINALADGVSLGAKKANLATNEGYDAMVARFTRLGQQQGPPTFEQSFGDYLGGLSRAGSPLDVENQIARAARGNLTLLPSMDELGEYFQKLSEGPSDALASLKEIDFGKQFGSELNGIAEQFGANLRGGLRQALLTGNFKSLGDAFLVSLQAALVDSLLSSAGSLLIGKFGSGSFLGGIGKGLGGKAAGGPVSFGTPYLVGEKGPEIFTPERSGRIIPNHRIGSGVAEDMRGAGGRGAPVHFHNEFVGDIDDIVRESLTRQADGVTNIIQGRLEERRAFGQ